ncbi:hypothetical protein B296_00032106 [Ensete ventricosum]|uniref:Uncharacterized protein n=1 Tax=Ensete ventricosum TaxID=4639 RepID=A0A427AEP9_ENSVE|nr:hypothetical protein B296_00032106 [Ensete ventricosum]
MKSTKMYFYRFPHNGTVLPCMIEAITNAAQPHVQVAHRLVRAAIASAISIASHKRPTASSDKHCLGQATNRLTQAVASAASSTSHFARKQFAHGHPTHGGSLRLIYQVNY